MGKNNLNASILNPEGNDDDLWRFRGGSTSRAAVQERLNRYSSGRPRAASASSVKSVERRYAILRVGKIKTMGHLAAAADHLSRDRETPNADLSRLSDNQLLMGPEGAEAVKAAWQDRAPEKIRKNAVHALEYVITASPDAMRVMTPQDQSSYFDDALAFIEARHGSENVLTAVVHRDEMTPHLQALVIPIDERGKLNAREFVGGKQNLREMQTDFANLVADRFGLERGLERSQAQHQTIKEYYAKAELRPEPDFSPPEREKGLFRTEPPESYLKRLTEAYSASYGDAVAHYDQREEALRGHIRSMQGKMERVETLETELGEVKAQNAEMNAEFLAMRKTKNAIFALNLWPDLRQEVQRQDGLRAGEALRWLAETLRSQDRKLTEAQVEALPDWLFDTVDTALGEEGRARLERGDYKALSGIIANPVDQIDVTCQYLKTSAEVRSAPELKDVVNELLHERAPIAGRQILAASRRRALEKGISLDDGDDMGL